MPLKVGIVLLAAGESRRMGSPKQLLDVGGIPMLRRAALSALAASMDPVVVVCGAACDEVRRTVADLPLRAIENPLWKDGMGSSIRAGLEAMEDRDVDAAIVALGDQPLLGPECFVRLAATWMRDATAVVASTYAGTVGAPVLFARSTFAKLKEMPAGQGFKKAILDLPAAAVSHCPCPEAAIDIDTPEDYGRLLPLAGCAS